MVGEVELLFAQLQRQMIKVVLEFIQVRFQSVYDKSIIFDDISARLRAGYGKWDAETAAVRRSKYNGS